MEALEGQAKRRQRTGVDIPVTVTTVLESMAAAIADLTERGALITGCALDAGARIQIEYMGQTIYARCRWAEVDRMGVELSFPLTDGPLYERLMIARAAQLPGEIATGTHMAYAPMQAPAFGRAHGAAGFGRRAG